MFSVASASEIYTAAISDLSGVVATVLGVVVTASIGFFVLRWALRKIRGAVR